MAEHADTADRQVNDLSSSEESSAEEDELLNADERKNNEILGDTVETPGLKRRSSVRLALALSAAVVAVLGCLVGWYGYRAYETHLAKELSNQLIAAARQGALNLTTIDYTRVDADVQRILDSSTGSFKDEFGQRSQPFMDVVKAAQSKSEGTITEAGLQSRDGEKAEVLVAVMVKTASAGTPEPDPRRWRMRITVEKVGPDAKVSNVQFVP